MGFFEGANNFTVNNGKFLDIGNNHIQNNNSRQVRNVNSNNTTIEYSTNSHNNSSRRLNRTHYDNVGTVNNQSGQRNVQTYYQATQQVPGRPQGSLNMRTMDEVDIHAFRQQMNVLRMEGRAGSDDESSDEDQVEEFPASSRSYGTQPQPKSVLPDAGITLQPVLPHSQSEPLPTTRLEFKSNNPFVKLMKSQGSRSQGQLETFPASAQGLEKGSND